ALNGLARFADLTIDKPATRYTLQASGQDLVSVITVPFSVQPVERPILTIITHGLELGSLVAAGQPDEPAWAFDMARAINDRLPADQKDDTADADSDGIPDVLEWSVYNPGSLSFLARGQY